MAHSIRFPGQRHAMHKPTSRVTIRDVAKRAGVSFQTVSLVLNHPERVADETRTRVQLAIDALGFVPSMAARSLRKQPTRTLACIFFGPRASYDNRTFQIQDTYLNNVVQMLTRVADQAGYALLQRNLPDADADALNEIHHLFAAGRIDGMVAVVGKGSHPILPELERQGFPFVLFGTTHPKYAFVAQANEEATVRIVDHLHAGGCRNIAFIPGQRDGHVHDDVDERQRGYARAMKGLRLRVEKRWQRAGDWSLASGHRIAHELCADPRDRPDALIFASDRMALGALKGLHELKVRVPDEVAVAGFDNMQYDEFSIPSLTSVHSPILEMADAAVKFLLAQIEGKAELAECQKVFEAPLVMRDSTPAEPAHAPAPAPVPSTRGKARRSPVL
ncbi:LacI family DNA-binding transcriptional regulator [Trinickia sp.]|uniref:LacI family DNA-binding transcriptional regulator n=1 Tax=Trinickia sp. TaxID=2571163 RepID=UPI003F81A04C